MLVEYYYESGNAPHEALGRAARRLSSGGALYLGGGVGIEKQQGKDGAATFNLTRSDSNAKQESFTGPLSAVMRGFAVAGAMSASDTPGGSTQVADPAVAARLRELVDNERECRKDIERLERRMAARQAQPANGMVMARPTNDDAWDQRRLTELRSDLASIEAERRKLLASGKVEEVEQARPGTNFTKIPAGNLKKLAPLVKHYRGQAHPFTACVRDQMKHGLSRDHANRRCAVVKDIGEGTTKWRKGGSKLKEAHDAAIVAERVAEAAGRLEAIDAQLGAGACVELAERAGDFGNETMDALGEQAFADLGQLFLAGHPFGVVWQESREALAEGFEEHLHPRNFLGRFRKKVGDLKPGETAHAPGGIKVTRKEDGFHVKGGSGLGAKPAADETHPAPNIAAMMATNRSLRSHHPQSLGGKTAYTGIDDFEKKAPKDPNLAKIARQHDQAEGAAAHARYRAQQEAGREGVPSKEEYFRLMNTAGALSGERTRKAISDDDLDKLIKGHPVHSPGAKSRLEKFEAEKRRRERAAKKAKPELARSYDAGRERQAEVDRIRRLSPGADREAQDRRDALSPQGQARDEKIVGLQKRLKDAESRGDRASVQALRRAIEREGRGGGLSTPARRGQDLAPQESAADRVAVKRKLRAAKPGETVELPNGTKVEKMGNGNYVANGHNVGPNLDRASEVAAAAERVKAKRKVRSLPTTPSQGVRQPGVRGGGSGPQKDLQVGDASEGAFRRQAFGLQPGQRALRPDGSGVALVGEGPGSPGKKYVSFGPGRTKRVDHGSDADAAVRRAMSISGAGESAEETRKRAQDTDDEKLLKARPKIPLGTPEKHQLRIARQTLRLSDAGSSIMGGMSKDEARKFIRRVAKLNEAEAPGVLDTLLESSRA